MIATAAKRDYDRRRYLANTEAARARAHAAYSANPVKARGRIKKWQDGNPDKVAEYRERQRIANAETERERLRRYAAAHPERVRETKRRWKVANPEKSQAWRLAHPGRTQAIERASHARRRAQLLRATPAWVSESEHREIRGLYAEAVRLTLETGESHHVDHVLPLRGRRVCGLHVRANLQVITAHENCVKSNRDDHVGDFNGETIS